MSNRLQENAIDAGHAVRKLTAPRGKRYETLDPTLPIRGNLFLVDRDLAEGDLDAARRDFVREQWAKRNHWAKGPVRALGAGHPLLAYIFLSSGALVFGLTLTFSQVLGDGIGLISGFLLLWSLLWCGFSFLVILQQRKFRPGEITLDEAPARLGGTIRGRVRTGISTQLDLQSPFSLSLRCRKVVRSSSQSGGSRETKTTVWSQESSRRGIVDGGDDCHSVIFEFPIPEDHLPWTLGSGTEGVCWELLVKAEMPGINYSDSFLVPVLSARDYDIVTGANC